MKKILAVALALATSSTFAGLLVTEVNGKPKIEGKGPVTTLAVIADGAQLSVPAGAHIVAVDLASGREYMLKGASKYLVAANGPHTPDGLAIAAKNLPAKNLPAVRIASGKVAQATLVMRGLGKSNNVPMLQSPVRTTVTTETPQFRWNGVESATTYRLKVTNDEGNAIWETTTHETTASLPANNKLALGERYTWRVEALGEGGTISDASAGFSVAPGETLERLAQLKPEADATFSRKVLYAAQLVEAGANEDAKAMWKTLSKEHPDDTVLKALAE